MSLLVVSNIARAFGAEDVLEDVTFRLEWSTRLGVCGRNGAGKTTLLRIVTGNLEPDRGTVRFAPGITCGYLRQEAAFNPDTTVLEVAQGAFRHIQEMEARLRDLEHEMSGASHAALDAVMDEYGLLRDRFEAMGGYESLKDIPSVLRRLGFADADLRKRAGALSGGEKTRLGLATLLLSGPDVLLLDEPTNHLDIDATEWLEGFLRGFGGGLLLVSHDRVFLDRVATAIGELEGGRLTIYPGNYSAYAQQRDARRKRQAELAERDRREYERLMTFFEKWKNTPSKRLQAQERFRAAQKLAASAHQAPSRRGASARLAVRASGGGGNEVLIADGLTKGYGGRTLFRDLNLIVLKGQRVGIVGPNGAGKSTLVRTLVGREAPDDGMARFGAGITVGYFAQDTSDLDLDESVLENLLDVADMTPEQARTHLGRFLFSGEDVYKPVHLLSGGEKNKLSLARIAAQHPNLLVLDEPTNHLDLESRDALGRMLREFAGTVVLVSHDRYLLDEVCTHTIIVDNGHATVHEGNYSTARRARVGGAPPPRQQAAASSAASATVARLLSERPQPGGALEASRQRKRLLAHVAELEQRITELEQRQREIERDLSAPGPEMDVVALSLEHEGIGSALREAMSRWEESAAVISGDRA